MLAKVITAGPRGLRNAVKAFLDSLGYSQEGEGSEERSDQDREVGFGLSLPVLPQQFKKMSEIENLVYSTFVLAVCWTQKGWLRLLAECHSSRFHARISWPDGVKSGTLNSRGLSGGAARCRLAVHYAFASLLGLHHLVLLHGQILPRKHTRASQSPVTSPPLLFRMLRQHLRAALFASWAPGTEFWPL